MRIRTQSPKRSPKRDQNDREISAWPARTPNAETLAAIEELESGKGWRAATVEEMMAELNRED
jgi:antitoxin component of RelBE/YafQ-DinJ toxin-antitoxin module